jgi:hypothetical protein
MNVECHTTLKGVFASLKKVAHFLSKCCFLAKFNPSSNGTYWKVQMLLFVDLLGPSMLFIRGLKFQAPSIWDIEANCPSTKGFYVPMATSYVCPFGIWAGTSMLFSGGGTSPPHWANNAFTCGCAFERTLILAWPLPPYWKPNFGRVFYPCDMKWHCCKTCIPPSLACPLASNTVDSTHFTFLPSIKEYTQK